MAKKKTTKKRVNKKVVAKIKAAIGRPTLYRREFCQGVKDYFNVEPYRDVTRTNQKTGAEYEERIANTLPTLVGFAAHIDVSRSVLQEWGKRHPEFLYAVTCAKAKAEHMLVTNSLLGLYNPQFAQFTAKNYTDMRDVQEFKDLTDEKEPRTPDEIMESIAELNIEYKRLEAEL